MDNQEKIDGKAQPHVSVVRMEDHISPLFLTYHLPVFIMVAYLVFVKYIGPSIMNARKPFVLKNTVRIYNIFQIAMNTYMIYFICSATGIGILNFWGRVCDVLSAVNKDQLVVKETIILGLYYYFINKLIDLMDTVLFILRKKESQITFLHVYHHVIMVGSSWISLMVFRDEILISFAAINSLVHVFMYSYYFLSSLGPAIQKYLWWKKYITSLQIAQFFLGLSMLASLKLHGCESSPHVLYLWTFNISTLIVLFSQFYIKSYSTKKKVN